MSNQIRGEVPVPITEMLQAAFAAAAAAREQLDTAEDNVRALVTDAIAAGVTWAELEQISGLTDITLHHRYQLGGDLAVEVVPAEHSFLL